MEFIKHRVTAGLFVRSLYNVDLATIFWSGAYTLIYLLALE